MTQEKFCQVSEIFLYFWQILLDCLREFLYYLRTFLYFLGSGKTVEPFLYYLRGYLFFLRAIKLFKLRKLTYVCYP
jgi:hypothetical protein